MNTLILSLALLAMGLFGFFLGCRFAMSAAKEFSRRLVIVLLHDGFSEIYISQLLNKIGTVSSEEYKSKPESKN